VNTFYLTFPERLKRAPLKDFPPAHPEGWVVVEAASEGQARWMAREMFGSDWFGLYPSIHEAEYPRGEIGRLSQPQRLGALLLTSSTP